MGGWGGCKAGSAPHVWGGVGVLCCAPGGCAVGLVGSEQRGPSVGAPHTALRRCGAAGGVPSITTISTTVGLTPPSPHGALSAVCSPTPPSAPQRLAAAQCAPMGSLPRRRPFPRLSSATPHPGPPPGFGGSGIAHLCLQQICAAQDAPPPAPRDPRHVPAALARPPHRPGSRRWGSQWGPLSPAGLWGGGGGAAAGWGGATPTPVGSRGPIPPFLRPYVLGAPRLCWWGASPQEGFPPTHHP